MRIKCQYCGTRFESKDKYCPFCFTRADKKLRPNPDECCDNKYVDYKTENKHVEKEKMMQSFEENRVQTAFRKTQNTYRRSNTARMAQNRTNHTRRNTSYNRKQKPGMGFLIFFIIYLIASILRIVF